MVHPAKSRLLLSFVMVALVNPIALSAWARDDESTGLEIDLFDADLESTDVC